MPQSIPSASAAKPRGRRRWNRARNGHAVDVGAVVGDDDDDDNSAAAVATSVLVLAGAVECILVPLMSGGDDRRQGEQQPRSGGAGLSGPATAGYYENLPHGGQSSSCTCPRQGAPRGAPRRGAAGRGASGLPAVCVPLEVVHLLGVEGRDDLPAGLLHIRG